MKPPLSSITRLVVILGVMLLKLAAAQDCQQQLDNDTDAEVKPCENFHQYACGNWYSNTSQRILGAHDMRSKWVANLKLQLIRYLEESSSTDSFSANTSVTTSTAQLGTLYRCCLLSGQSIRTYTDALSRSGANFLCWPTILVDPSIGFWPMPPCVRTELRVFGDSWSRTIGSRRIRGSSTCCHPSSIYWAAMMN